jgi:NADPH2:quinone reductase
MKETRVYKDYDLGLRIQLHEVPIPKPKADEVLIKVAVSGSNPKDWKFLSVYPGHNGFNSGDDIAGIVESVGSEAAWEFKPGDRVAAFHLMMSSSGSYAEYAIAPSATTFHIPPGTSFEEAATIPLCAITAALGLFSSLELPQPWVGASPARARVQQGGIIIYGAASVTGAFAIKLLIHANIHPIFCVAGSGIPFVKTLIDSTKGDRIIDYREGNNAIVRNLKASVPAGHTCAYAYDSVSDDQSIANIAQVLDPQGHIALLWPLGEHLNIPKSIHLIKISVAVVHEDEKYRDFAYAWFRLFSLGLQQGWLTGHPYEVCEGGLQGVETGLRNLMNGKASAIKYIFRVADTPGLL